MRIHNTLTGRAEEFVPPRDRPVSIYVCGPTVYDDPHIGHLRSAFVFDLARRVIAAVPGTRGVRFVRNVTDVDDKIIDRAKADGVAIETIARRYLAAYHEALSAIGIEPPTDEPKATQHIADMIAMIGRLVESGSGYAAAGSVYFDVRNFKGYGALSHQNPDEMLKNARAEPGEGKRNDLDFALWKRSAEGEPAWDSPWGKGRPGWHIECSAMSMRTLGEEFDIHGGGRDLLFPHHENERTQAIAASGKGFARIWMHHGLLTVEGRKMSKSLGNFITLESFAARHSVEVLKFFFLQSHYRSDADFSWERMPAIEEALNAFYRFFGAVKEQSGEKTAAVPMMAYEKAFDAALCEDFDTPKALSVLFGALHEGNVALAAEGREKDAAGMRVWLEAQFKFLGLSTEGEKQDWQQWSDRLLKLREKKRAQKEFKVSDAIRSDLVALGFEAQDGKDALKLWHPRKGTDRVDLVRKLKALAEKYGE